MTHHIPTVAAFRQCDNEKKEDSSVRQRVCGMCVEEPRIKFQKATALAEDLAEWDGMYGAEGGRAGKPKDTLEYCYLVPIRNRVPYSVVLVVWER